MFLFKLLPGCKARSAAWDNPVSRDPVCFVSLAEIVASDLLCNAVYMQTVSTARV